MSAPLIDNRFLLEKYPGKGGWTYTILPGIPATLRSKGGMVRVSGFIDGFEISSYNLFPLKDRLTTYFFPIKAGIRKKIGKEAGDYVHIVLYADNEPMNIPEEIMLCLRDEPDAYTFFNSLQENEQENYIKWISSAKTDKTKVERMALMIEGLMQQKKLARS